MNRLFAFLTAALAAVASVRADYDEPAASAPYFVVTSATPPGLEVLPLKDTHVEATIAGVIAEVSVVQTYANEGADPIEAVYVFPGSTRAAIHALTMVIGDRVVRAQIQPRQEARQTYETAKTAGKTATLLEQDRPNLFRMNLANILPGDVVRVELRYTELLACDPARRDEYEFVFPTVVGPRYTRGPQSDAADGESPSATAHLAPGEAERATFGFNLHLATGVPIAAVRSTTHPMKIESPSPATANLRLDPAADPTEHANRDVVVRYRLAGDAVQAGLLLSRTRGATEGYFLAMIQPPARVEPAAIPPRDYVFVVDVSGSMNGFPIDTTKALLADLLGSLRATDSFNLVLFAGGSAVLSHTPLPATPEYLAEAIVLLERQQAGGGTELLPALETALQLPANPAAARTIVVVTDGLVTIEAEAFDLVRRHLGEANLFAFGIGTSVNRHLIEGLARSGQGEPEIVMSEPEAHAAAVRFRRRIESPVLTHVRAQFEEFRAVDVTPAALPDVFAQRPVVLFGKWAGVPGGRIRLSGMSGDGTWETTLDVTQAVMVENSRALELLWARAQITALEDAELAGRDPERVSAITRLGLAHGLLTKHTSFIAVDEVVRNPSGTPRTAQQPAPLPEGVTSAAVGGTTVATTPEPAAVGLVALAALALACTWWRRRAHT